MFLKLRKRAAVAAIAVSVVVGLVAGNTWAAGTFTDTVGNNHENSIDAIAAAGITLGCNPPTNDNYCPNNNVTRAQMASFLARGLGLSSGATKNFPKANARSELQTYCALAAASPRTYPTGPCQLRSSVIDSTGNVGFFASSTVGINRLPIVSYWDSTNGDLKVAACTTADCTGTPTITAVDTVSNVGPFTSIAIGRDNLPIISYSDDDADDLKVAACTTTDCTGVATVTALDTVGIVGRYTSIAIGTNGLPIISYHDTTNGDLKVAACTTTNCTGTPTITTLDSSNNIVGRETSITIGTNGLPIISYVSISTADLRVAACTTIDCTGTPTVTTLDSTGLVGYESSIAIGVNGFPVISYLGTGLRVAACTTIDCTGTPTITILDSTAGRYTSIAIGTTGRPIISYYGNELKLAVCATADCSGTSTITTLDNAGNVGRYSSVAIGIDGVPIIHYYDDTNGDLKVAQPAVS